MKELKKKSKEPPSETPKLVNEPETVYGESKIQIFSSFEEMNEADAKEMAVSIPLENLKRAIAYIMHLYAEELKNKMTDLTIHLKNNGHTNS
ncbi:MAG TPA: hypothetical protein PKD91_03260 [Bacteroidia bacterium]|nr:hypothetical protein [Bacteroidia bacterium]